MTDSYGPYEVAPWGEADWLDFAFTWAQSGVIGTPATAPTSGELAFASSGLNVSAGPGKAWVRGTGFKRTGTPPTHAAGLNSHASFSRRDRLVLRRDPANNQTVTAILQGTPAATPTPPAPTQLDGGVWEILLHSFLVPPNNGTTITGVLDERQWLSDQPISGKMWRTSGFSSNAAAISTDYVVKMDAGRVSGGVVFDAASETLDVPVDGLYDLSARAYATGASNAIAQYVLKRNRPSTGELDSVVAQMHTIYKPNSLDAWASGYYPAIPLKAGDRVFMVYSVNDVSLQYWGVDEAKGVLVALRYVGPLNGATPL